MKSNALCLFLVLFKVLTINAMELDDDGDWQFIEKSEAPRSGKLMIVNDTDQTMRVTYVWNNEDYTFDLSSQTSKLIPEIKNISSLYMQRYYLFGWISSFKTSIELEQIRERSDENIAIHIKPDQQGSWSITTLFNVKIHNNNV